MAFLVLRKAVSNHANWYVVCLLIASADLASAIPPLVSGDVPTAGKGIYELFMGYLLEEKSGLKTHTLKAASADRGLSQNLSRSRWPHPPGSHDWHQVARVASATVSLFPR